MKTLKADNTKSQPCDIKARESSCPGPTQSKINPKEHWNNTYSKNPENKLGWYETDLSATFKLINKTNLAQDARILNVGSGSTTLVDKLLEQGYKNIIATDISEVALTNLQERLRKNSVKLIVDDLTNPSKLTQIKPIDFWIDRAVLHFFTEEKEQETYFTLLKTVLKTDGYALLAQFNLQGAEKCSGLPIHRYNAEMLQAKLGNDFTLVESFDYTYTMPSGDLRPYVYTLFRKK